MATFVYSWRWQIAVALLLLALIVQSYTARAGFTRRPLRRVVNTAADESLARLLKALELHLPKGHLLWDVIASQALRKENNLSNRERRLGRDRRQHSGNGASFACVASRSEVQHFCPTPGQRLAAACNATNDWLQQRPFVSSLGFQQYQICSEGGQDGVLSALFKELGVRNAVYVELGVRGSANVLNSSFLRLFCGWTGVMLDPSPKRWCLLHADVDAREACEAEDTAAVDFLQATPHNVNQLLDKFSVPQVFDLLSIDLGGNDFWVWQALDEARHRARVVAVRVQPSVPDRALTMPMDPHHRWGESNRDTDGRLHDFFGASMAAWQKLAQEKDYCFVHTTVVHHAFFVDCNLLAPDDRGLEPPRHQLPVLLPTLQHRADLWDQDGVLV